MPIGVACSQLLHEWEGCLLVESGCQWLVASHAIILLIYLLCLSLCECGEEFGFVGGDGRVVDRLLLIQHQAAVELALRLGGVGGFALP